VKLDITGQGFTIAENLRDHVEKRIDFALARFEERIVRVSVKLKDINGPRGGVDKECRIITQLRGLPNVIVTQEAPDAHSAVDQAADRIGNTVARKLSRANSRNSQHPV
jgi:ribosomal subunit interface protein